MRYIFIIQGEGRGHLTQAITLSALLRGAGHTVDRVLVGRCNKRELPEFFAREIGAPIGRYDAPSIDYGKGGKRGNMFVSTLKGLAPWQLLKWYRSTRFIASEIAASRADVVINLYELLMGATAMIHRIKVPIISIAHQFIIDHPGYPLRRKGDSAQMMLSQNNRICGYGSSKILALSLYELPTAGKIAVVPPLLRGEIFSMQPTSKGYLLGYMLNPAYLDEVVAWRERNAEPELHLFWDKAGAAAVEEHRPGLFLHRIDDKAFIELMEHCCGYLTTAGFESVCEAAFMGKPVMMVAAHLEQEINAREASSLGIGVVASSFEIERLTNFIPEYSFDSAAFRAWVGSSSEHTLRELTTL
ncbi:MAG: glycosyltransferase family protein [Rikenellaceae bacterium]